MDKKSPKKDSKLSFTIRKLSATERFKYPFTYVYMSGFIIAHSPGTGEG